MLSAVVIDVFIVPIKSLIFEMAWMHISSSSPESITMIQKDSKVVIIPENQRVDTEKSSIYNPRRFSFPYNKMYNHNQSITSSS